jgi:hypothetical protein
MVPGPGFIETAAGGTRLITEPRTLQVWSNRRETDARTAMARGLTEYLRSLSIELDGGRALKFTTVVDTWAEGEVMAVYPSAAVHSEESGMYEVSALTPQINEAQPDGRYFTVSRSLRQQFLVDVWCTGPKERMALAAMLEDASDPVEWMGGFLLELPHYHNARAQFDAFSGQYMDVEADAAQRYRRFAFVVTGMVPVVVVRDRRKPLRPRIDLQVDGLPAFD